MTKGNIDDFEIMAPVGSRESLQAAIQAGAGSVYFGVGRLNMRAHSANTFTTDDLRDIASTCAAHGIKTYLTVNTIIYDDDIEDMHAIVGAAKEAGISAVIASDMAVITYCRSVGMEVHLRSSTYRTSRRWSSTPGSPTWPCWPASLRWTKWGGYTARWSAAAYAAPRGGR